MTIGARHARLFLGTFLAILFAGCSGDSSSCSRGNGQMCDLFSLPLKLAQDEPRLHFTNMQVVEGRCGAPRCYTADCSTLVFDDLFHQLDVSTSAATDLPPGTLCRY